MPHLYFRMEESRSVTPWVNWLYFETAHASSFLHMQLVKARYKNVVPSFSKVSSYPRGQVMSECWVAQCKISSSQLASWQHCNDDHLSQGNSYRGTKLDFQEWMKRSIGANIGRSFRVSFLFSLLIFIFIIINNFISLISWHITYHCTPNIFKWHELDLWWWKIWLTPNQTHIQFNSFF